MTRCSSLAPSYGVLCVFVRGDVSMDYRQGLRSVIHVEYELGVTLNYSLRVESLFTLCICASQSVNTITMTQPHINCS